MCIGNDARNSYENIESGEMMSENTWMCEATTLLLQKLQLLSIYMTRHNQAIFPVVRTMQQSVNLVLTRLLSAVLLLCS